MSSLNGMKLKDFARAWTTEVGYPLVRISVGNGGKVIRANQTRFLYLTEKRDTQKYGCKEGRVVQ